MEIARISALHTAIQKINENASWYSNPANLGRLPFFFLFAHLPVDRFDLDDTLLFTYMGREAFDEVWQDVESLKGWQRYTRVYIEGTIGYGTSYILAALAAFLSRSGKHPVYIPDCRELLRNEVPYVQSSLLSAFSAPSLTPIRNEIRALKSRDDLIQFCRSQPNEPENPLYFIIDQQDALDRGEENKDTASNTRKEEVSCFLDKIAVGHFTIVGASANCNTALRMMSRQRSEMTLSLKGGMSQVSKYFVHSYIASFFFSIFIQKEMDNWWPHMFPKAVPFQPDDKARIEYLTGCIPLLLRPLLQLFPKDKFKHVDQFEELMLTSRELLDVGGNIRSFARMIMDHPRRNYE
jgi:hypothetical protein